MRKVTIELDDLLDDEDGHVNADKVEATVIKLLNQAIEYSESEGGAGFWWEDYCALADNMTHSLLDEAGQFVEPHEDFSIVTTGKS